MDTFFTQLTILAIDHDRVKKLVPLDLLADSQCNFFNDRENVELCRLEFFKVPEGMLVFEDFMKEERIPFHKYVAGQHEFIGENHHFWIDEAGESHYSMEFESASDTLSLEAVEAQYEAGTLREYLNEHKTALYVMPWSERLSIRNRALATQQQTS